LCGISYDDTEIDIPEGTPDGNINMVDFDKGKVTCKICLRQIESVLKYAKSKKYI
jgi:hypothetical protein